MKKILSKLGRELFFKSFEIMVIALVVFLLITFNNKNTEKAQQEEKEKTTSSSLYKMLENDNYIAYAIEETPKEKSIIDDMTDNEIIEMKHLIFAECGNEPIEGMAEVFFCILNRVDNQSNDFKSVNSIHDVIYQSTISTNGHITYQFSCVPTDNFTNDDNTKLEWFEEKWNKMINDIDNEVYENDNNLFYCRTYCNQWHRENLKYLYTIGLHEFYTYEAE